jgi:hypothetical protein
MSTLAIFGLVAAALVIALLGICACIAAGLDDERNGRNR